MRNELLEVADRLRNGNINITEAREEVLILFGVKGSLYDIADREGSIMPRHYSGRPRTEKEAKDMVEALNINGEYAPYKMVYVITL